jgi:hypothetical protein
MVLSSFRGCFYYSFVLVFDPLLFDNPWGADLFPTVLAIKEQSYMSFMPDVYVDWTV